MQFHKKIYALARTPKFQRKKNRDSLGKEKVIISV